MEGVYVALALVATTGSRKEDVSGRAERAMDSFALAAMGRRGAWARASRPSAARSSASIWPPPVSHLLPARALREPLADLRQGRDLRGLRARLQERRWPPPVPPQEPPQPPPASP